MQRAWLQHHLQAGQFLIRIRSARLVVAISGPATRAEGRHVVVAMAVPRTSERVAGLWIDSSILASPGEQPQVISAGTLQATSSAYSIVSGHPLLS